MFAFARRYPLATYFVVAFALSWGAVLAVILPGDIPASPEDAARVFVFVYLGMLIGPPIAGLIVTAIVARVGGLRDFLARLTRWRVAMRWYGVALLTAPLTLALAIVVLSPLSDAFSLGVAAGPTAGPIQAASRATRIGMALAVGLGAGFFEELGWTGLAVPAMRTRYDVTISGLGVGTMWGAWHALAVYWGSANAFGSVPRLVFMLGALFSFLPAYRVLMVWMYDHTQSLLLAILMHASLTSSMIILGPAVAGASLVVYDITFASILWMLAGALALSRRRSAGARRRLEPTTSPRLD